MADRKYPRHDFWGAGEPDCPADLKAPNGELRDMRCKVCGDGWRDSNDVCMAALTESFELIGYLVYETKFGGHWDFHPKDELPAGDFLKHRSDHTPVYKRTAGVPPIVEMTSENKDLRPAAPGLALPAGPLAQVVAGIAALDDGHDPLCMAVLRGKACTCGVPGTVETKEDHRG